MDGEAVVWLLPFVCVLAGGAGSGFGVADGGHENGVSAGCCGEIIRAAFTISDVQMEVYAYM